MNMLTPKATVTLTVQATQGPALSVSFSDFLGKELNGCTPIPETLNGGLESRAMLHRHNWYCYKHAEIRGDLGEEERQSS